MRAEPGPSRTAAKPSGAAAAAYLSAMSGLLAMALAHLLTTASTELQQAIFAIGRAWIPGAAGLGPYSGLETIGLVVWLGSWVLLHLAMRRQDVSTLTTGLIFLLGMVLATALFWPPIIHALVG